MHSVSGSTLLTLKICTGPRPLDGAVKLKNADNAVTYCCRSERGSGSDQSAAAMLHGYKGSGRLPVAIKGYRRNHRRHRGNLPRLLPLISAVLTLPPWSRQRERAAFVCPVGGGSWFMACPAAH